MNIYEKIQQAKKKLLEKGVSQSGENTFSKYTYFELSDFMPSVIEIFDELKLFSKVTFTTESAILTIIDAEKPDDREEYISPMKELDIKGANAMQQMGGIQTYQRRYLYMSALDITESDMFDASNGKTAEKDNDASKSKEYKCSDCGKPFTDYTDKSRKKWTAAQVYHMAENSNADKKARCKDCKAKLN